MVSDPISKKQKVYKKILRSSNYYNQRDLLLGKNYNFSQKRSVFAALQEISSTRKTGQISESRKLKILEELAQYPPDVVEYGCDQYVAKNRAAEGKKENYLIAIVRNETKNREIQKKRREASDAAAAKIDRDKFWRDGNRIYKREDLERWWAEVQEAHSENRPTDHAKVRRVNRCINERPNWDWV